MKKYYQKTTNESFNKIAMYLKTKGITNYQFMNVLINTKLKDIYPYDYNLSSEEKYAVLQECKQNYWYFIREIVKIPTVTGEAARYKINPLSAAFSYCKLKSRNTITNSSRMTYATLSECIWYLWNLMLGDKINIKFINRHKADSITLLSLLYEIYKELPSYFHQYNIYGTEKYKFRRENIFNTEVDSSISIFSNITSPKKIQQLEKDGDLEDVFVDDFGYIQNNHIYHSAISKNLGDKRKNEHVEKRKPSFSYNTTGADSKTPYGEFTKSLCESCCIWDDKMYDMQKLPHQIIYIQKMPEELLLDDLDGYLTNMKKSLPSEAYDREVLLKW